MKIKAKLSGDVTEIKLLLDSPMVEKKKLQQRKLKRVILHI